MAEFAFVSTVNSTDNSASLTGTDLSIGAAAAGRIIYVTLTASTAGGDTLTGLTCDGVAMTFKHKVIGVAANIKAAYIYAIDQEDLPDPSETTATFVATWSATSRGKQLAVYRGVGYSITPSDVGGGIDSDPITDNVTYPAAGIVLACANCGDGTAETWPAGGLTENASNTLFFSRQSSASASGVTGGATDVTVDWTGFTTNAAMAVACFPVATVGELAAPAQGNLTLDGKAPTATVEAGHTVAPGAGTLALDGLAPEALLGSTTIPAVVADGLQSYKKHTGGPAGAVDGPTLTLVASRTFNSDGSAMSIRRVINGNGTVVSLRRLADNTIEFKGFQSDASTPVFSVATSAVAASLGMLIIFAWANGTTAGLKVVHAGGTITGTNTPGSAGDLDLGGSDWWYEQSGANTEFGDYDIHLDWDDDAEIDFTVADNIEQFWDTTAGLLRDPGADGSNPVDGAYSPLIFHGSPAATHVVNNGTGGDADTAGTFANGTNPGFYSVDFDAGGALIVFGKGELVLDGKAPTPVATTHRTIIPAQGDLALDGKVPVPSTAAAAIVTPGSGDLVLDGKASTVTAEEHRTIVPQAGSLLLEGEAPEPLAENHLFAAPAAGDLALDGKAPTVTVALPSHTIAVGQGNILLFGFAPTVVDSSAPVVVPSQPRPGPAGSGFTARRDYDEVDRIVRQVREVYAELRKDVPADSAAAVEIAAAVAEYVAPDAPDVPPASEVDWAALGADGLVAVERLLMLLLAMERAFQEVRAKRLAEMQEEEDMEILMMVA